MEEYIYTNKINAQNSASSITSADIVMLNGNNIVHDINEQYVGINPIPSFSLVKSLSSQVSSRLSVIDNDLSIINNELSNYASKLSGSMRYLGSFTKGYKIDGEILSTFLDANLSINDVSETISQGSMFRFLSSIVLSDLNDEETKTITLLSNDYIIFNKNVSITNARITDFNVIRDAQVEVEQLSVNLCEIISNKADTSSLTAFYEKTETSSATEISVAFDELSVKADASILSDYLPLSGGNLTGDLSVTSHDIYILSGNIKQIYGSFSSGIDSIANDYAHAEGSYTKANKNSSHAEGVSCIADGLDGSHAEGFAVSALGAGSHAEGYRTLAEKDGAHAEGRESTAKGMFSHAEGGDYLGDLNYLPGGYATGNGSHAEGCQTSAISKYSHAEGYLTKASSNIAAHAEGVQSEATGSGAHAEGGAVLNGTTYKGGTANGAGSHASGYKTLAKGNWSFAGGEQTSAEGRCTFAFGDHAKALSDDMFVWNGVRDSTYIPTNNNATTGHFCINPTDGINGVWIGTQTLSSILSVKQDKLSDPQISAIDSVVDERSTYVKYQGGTISSFNIVGELSSSSILDKANVIEVKIGTAVSSIQTEAFFNRIKLTSVTIPDSVTRIGNDAFKGCPNITSVTIPDGVTSIGSRVFFGCSGLTRVTIGNGVTSIGSEVFKFCTNLLSVTVVGKTQAQAEALLVDASVSPSIITTWNDASQEWVNSQLSAKQDKLSDPQISAIDSVVDERQTVVKFVNNEIRYYDIAGELTQAIRQGWETDVGSSVKEVKIGNSVTNIGKEAFYVCSNLRSVTIPDSVTSIENSAFEECSGITSVTIGNSVNSIGIHSFSGCTSLTSVTIPNSVTSIWNSAFLDCANLTSITVVGKTQAQAEALLADASVPSGCEITTWNDASQEWVSSQISANLTSADISAAYANQHIYLSAKGQVVGNIDCADFIKDGMLSNVELCSGQLIFNFNTDAESSSISVALSNFIDETQYYTKSETSSANEISNAFASIDTGNKIFIDDKISSVSGYSDISVVKLDASEYSTLLTSNSLLSNALYIVQDVHIDAYGQQIKNLAEPTDLSDAANKKYVDSQVSSVNANLKEKISASQAINSFISQVTLNNGIDEVELKTTVSALIDLVNILSGNI